MIFRKLLRKWSMVIMFLVIFLCGFPCFLIGTQAGLHTLSFVLKIAMAGKLQLGSVQGRLLDDIHIGQLRWQDQEKTIRMRDIHIAWHWRWPVESPLVNGVLSGKSLQITQDQQDIHLTDLKGKFYGNSVKTLEATFTSKGLFNTLPFRTNMTWHQDTIDATIDAAPNQFHLTGKPSATLFIKADFPQPALLHPALKKLHTHIQLNGQWKQNASGFLVTTASAGYIQLPQQRLHFDQASFKNTIKAQHIQTTGTIQAKENILRLDMKLLPESSQWKGRINLSQGPHHMQLEGQGLLKPDISGDLTLSAKDFPIIDSNEYAIEASPNLKARFTTKHIDIQGDLAIPKALIQPLSFEEGQNVSDDVRFVQTEDIPLPFQVSMHINLIPGEQVFLNFKGLNTQLAGNLALHKTVESPITARGKLSMLKGKYKAYGQDLNIAQGELIFTGGLLTKPGIQLKAEKKLTGQIIPDTQLQLPNLQNSRLNTPVTVGISVSGWLTDPKLKLYAVPSVLPEADILSMLLLGHPINQASKAKAQLLLTLLTSMNKGQGHSLLQKVQKKLDIDVQVKTTSHVDKNTKTLTDSTGIVIGKALSKKLYISYNAGLSQSDTNTFTLNWLLNRFFSIQVTASNEGNGIDILYSSSKEPEHAKHPVKPNKTS